jgi:hypothetical protein
MNDLQDIALGIAIGAALICILGVLLISLLG